MAKPIRILCVMSTLDRGGAESMCMNLYRHIDRNKVQFDFVKHTRRTCAFEDEIIKLGGTIYTAPRYYAFNYVKYNNWWKRFLTNHPEYKVIHGHYFTISYIYFKIAHKFGRITIGHSHSSKPMHNSLKFWLKRALVKKVEEQSDYCLACSREAGAYLFPHKDFFVLNNAIDLSLYKYDAHVRKEVRNSLGITDETLVIGACGSFSIPKNPLGIIDIFSSVYKRHRAAKLLWVGDGDLRQDVETKIKKEGLESEIILTGIRSDVSRLYQAMDIFILPSLWEGLALVSIEAQAAGLPCLFSSNVTFLPINSPNLWADRILACNTDRTDTSGKLRMAGYDIDQTAK